MTRNPDWRLGLRGFPRDKIFQPANIAVGVRSARVHMLDVSQGGVRIHSTAPLAVGERVMLSWQDQSRIARVAWSRDSKSGLRFDVPLTQPQMETLLTPA